MVIEVKVGETIRVGGYEFVLVESGVRINEPAYVVFKQPVELVTKSISTTHMVTTQEEALQCIAPIHLMYGDTSVCGVASPTNGTYYAGLTTCLACREPGEASS